MFFNIFSFELKYRRNRAATYIYFFICFIIVTLMVAMGSTPAAEKVHHNSPFNISVMASVFSLLMSLICSAVMGVPLYRDIEYGTKDYYFTYPISKSDYFWGRFWGSFVVVIFISTAPLLGIWVGSMVGPLFGLEEADRYGANHLWSYVYPYLTMVLPNVFFTSCAFFALVAWTRNARILYTANILFFIAYLLADFLTRDFEKKNLVDILDPFALKTLGNATKYFTIADKNNLMAPFTGNLLWNRIIWVGFSLVIILVTYFRFSFQRFFNASSGRKKAAEPEFVKTGSKLALPKVSLRFDNKGFVSHLFNLAKLEFRNIIRDPYFLAILLGGVVFLILDDWIGTRPLDVSNRPLTFYMLEFKSYNYGLFVFILILFYTGETVHRDRSSGFSQISDTFPVPNWVYFGSKFISLAGVCLLLVSIPMIVGVGTQTLKGFFDYRFDFYFKDLYLITLPDYLEMTMLAFFVHILVNNKFLGHFLGIGVWFMMFLLQSIGKMDYNLFFYSYKPNYLISDMNGFGHFAKPLFWFNLYWIAFGGMLLLVGALFWNRGAEQVLRIRWKLARARWNNSALLSLLLLLCVWLGSGAFIYHNVSSINGYRTIKENNRNSADYEKQLKKFEGIPQPKVTDVRLEADVFPENRKADIRAWVTICNKTNTPIDSLHLLSSDLNYCRVSIDKQPLKEIYRFSYPKPKFSLSDPVKDGAYVIYKLPRTLQPGDSTVLAFETGIEYTGFQNSGFGRDILYNGTFFSGGLPEIGYNQQVELESDEERKKQGLKPKNNDMPPFDDPYGRATMLFNDDADLITFEATVSTSTDQIAIAPGYLQKEWTDKGRRYFQYKQDGKIDFFFNIVSANYAVYRDVWKGRNGKTVNIEIFHHPSHTYNIDRFVNGVKDALTYYSENFGDYQFRQMRILEFPRYAGFAQSFPNTVPYSEEMGWIADFSNPDAYDYAYYVTAHEVGHQWWGHQVVPNYTRGSNLISESLAEYSALMVAEKKYGSDNIQRFLKKDLNDYLSSRSNESKKENVYIDCNRPYAWYEKGSLIFYATRDYIGEDKLNQALRAFRDTFAFRDKPPFPGSHDLYHFIEAATPDSLRYFLEDSWKKITLYENRALRASARSTGKDEYDVTLTISSAKVYADSVGNEKPASVMNDYIDIGVFAAKSKDKQGHSKTNPLYLQKHRLTAGEHTIKIHVKGKPEKAGIDPYNKLIDRVSDDNTIDVDL